MGLIRFALALSVVFWHIRGAPFHLMNAAVAVTLFFIISGFYMAMVINEKYAPAGGHWIRTFYAARFWRLYPPYFVMLLVMLLWFWATNAPSPLFGPLPMPLLDQLGLAFSNIFLFGQDIHQFLVRVRTENAGPPLLVDFTRQHQAALDDSMMAIGHAWSLAVEACFYLIAPFIVRTWRRTAVILVLALALRFVLMTALEQRSGIWGYYFFPGALCMFLMGSAAYHLRKMLPRPDLHAAAGWCALAGFAALCLSAINGVLMESPSDWSIDRPQFWILYICFALTVPLMFEATKRSRVDREIGELSYPLYLVHGLVVGIAYYRWSAPTGVVPDAIAAATLSVFAAYVMRRRVEMPIEAWRMSIALPVRRACSGPNRSV